MTVDAREELRVELVGITYDEKYTKA